MEKEFFYRTILKCLYILFGLILMCNPRLYELYILISCKCIIKIRIPFKIRRLSIQKESFCILYSFFVANTFFFDKINTYIIIVSFILLIKMTLKKNNSDSKDKYVSYDFICRFQMNGIVSRDPYKILF
jgi:hypothetical protein